MPNSSAYLLPYGEYVKELLDTIFRLLTIYYRIEDSTEKGEKQKFDRSNQQVADILDSLSNILKVAGNDGLNNHLKEGLPSGNSPRIIKLISLCCRNAANTNLILAPSPLSILYQYLTVSEEPESSAYALAICRAILFTEYNSHPAFSDDENGHPKNLNVEGAVYKVFSQDDVQSSLDTFRNENRKSNNIDLGKGKDEAKAICAHFLAMKEIFYLRFDSPNTRVKYFENAKLSKLVTNSVNATFPEFKLSKDYIDIPNSSEVINYLYGIPLPIRGAETILFGGLKKDAKSSLVISLSGQAGAGKTSFALALAAALSPYKSRCYYISVEENPKDLVFRLKTLIPSYLKKLSIYKEPIESWFWPRSFKLEPNTDVESFINFLEDVHKVIVQEKEEGEKVEAPFKPLPPICPFIIVFDSLNGIIERASSKDGETIYSRLEDFVNKCREFNALVILLSGEDLPKNVKLDYLVDAVMNLRHEGTEFLDKKPIRILQLLKTRHQISRPGAHLVHLTGLDGLRISPQIPSQLDRKENIKRPLPNKNSIIQTLNTLDGFQYVPVFGERAYVNIFDNSQILIHGRGSSGKAGLALKILLSPAIEAKNKKDYQKDYVDAKALQVYTKRKVLIVSFLFEKDYYKELQERIEKLFVYTYPGYENLDFDCLYFFPGFLNPEDLINKITRKLDSEKLKGDPYTGILIDGVHNVFLQFPNLQKRDMVWPMLYSVLVRYKLMIVTTFTTFSLNNDEFGTSTENRSKPITYDDQVLLKEGHTPFMHALVQASDFFIEIEPKLDDGAVIYTISVKNAVDQTIRNGKLFFNKVNITLDNVNRRAPELPFNS